jgi:hypothetical protein
MALAILRLRGERDGFQEFDVEIGTNRYYSWSIGSAIQLRDGIQILVRRAEDSQLLGPLPLTFRGRTLLRIPSEKFTHQDHKIQLLSFLDEDLRGPSVSDIEEVPWPWTPRNRKSEKMRENESMAAITLSTPPVPVNEGFHVKPMSLGGRLPGSPQLSQAQFLQSLGGFISQILPIIQQAVPLVTQLVSPPASSSRRSGISVAPSNQDLSQLLSALLEQVQALAPASAPAKTSASVTQGIGPDGGSPAPQQPISEASSSYSFAAVAPLLAALPALAPLLQSVLTPQTVQSLISAADPSRLLQSTFAGLLDVARIGQQATDQLNAHLRALNPGTGDEMLIPLLASMSTEASTGDSPPTHRISHVVRLEVPDLVPVELQGYPQVAFRWGEDITIPVRVITPRSIPRPRLEVLVRDAITHVCKARRVLRFSQLEQGRLPEPVTLPAALTHRLGPGREYLISLRLLWPGRKGLVGTTIAQLVRLVGTAVFDSVDTGGAPIRLDDVERDREWWHRIWSENFDAESKRILARLDYDYRLLNGNRGNQRQDSQIKLAPVTERRVEGNLQTGLEVSLSSLSRLAEYIGASSFDEDTMQALADPAFREAFERTATCQLRLQGRRYARMAIWVWPEVKLHNVYLRVPGGVSPTTGQVLSFATRPVQVPIPGLVHVLTTRSA